MSNRELTFEKVIEIELSVDVDIALETALSMQEAGWDLVLIDGKLGDIDSLDPMTSEPEEDENG